MEVRSTLGILLALSGIVACSRPSPDEAPPADDTQFREEILFDSVAPEADAWVRGSTAAADYPDMNFGEATEGGVSADLEDRILIRFSPLAIQTAVDGEFISATLRFTVSTAADFDTGQTVNLHRLIQPWDEAAVTYNCAVDSNLGNSDPDCEGPTDWDVSPSGSNPWIAEIASTTITDESTVVEFDVTAEIASLLDGTIDHRGWVVALEDSAPGTGELYLLGGTYPPELEVEFDADPEATTWTPPDPEEVATVLDRTVVEGMAASVAFIYEGEDPIQIDVEEGAIKPARVGVIRGTVEAASGIPLGGVEVRVANHPELGMTETRSDGGFDFAGNGGGTMVLEFSRAGLFEVRRRVEVEWNGFVDLGTVVMVGPDETVTTIDFADPIEFAEATQVVDDRGVRTSVVMFREDTVATMIVPGESPEVLESIDVRATEYTVDEEGPEAMPGPLPQSTGYTFAVEFTVDEAEAAGATSVTFDPPAISYNDNFLDFPVGEAVPAGYWDDTKKTWLPGDDGLVIKIVGEDAGLALISIAGNDDPESSGALLAVGIDDDEREALLEIYGASSRELWRVETPHFSAWDLNWGVQPPEDGEACSGCGVDPPLECTSTESGSIIECESQGLGERVPVAGTGLSLNWRSSRVLGGPSYRLAVRLSGDDDGPASLLKMRTRAEVAGRYLSGEYDPDEFVGHEFVWDGKDAYGRQVQGAMPIEVCVDYIYPMVYVNSSSWSDSKFGYKGNGYVIGVDQASQTTSLTKCFGRIPIGTGGDGNAISTPNKLLIGGLDAQQASDQLGGWTLSNHHTFSKEASTVYYGDGSKRDVGGGLPIISTYAGNNLDSGSYTGVDRLSARFGITGATNVSAIAVAPDGDLYVGYKSRIVRIERDDDVVYAFAGTGTVGFSGDGGAATSAAIQTPTGIDVAPDGSVYFMDAVNLRIRKVDPDGVITTVGGNGSTVASINSLDENDPSATSVALGGSSSGLKDLAVGPDGDVYYRTQVGSAAYVRHLTPGGTVRHLAGYPRADNWAGTNPGGSEYYGYSPIYYFVETYGTRLVADADGGVLVGQSKMARLKDMTESIAAATNINSGSGGGLAIPPDGEPIWYHTTEDQIVTLIDDEIVPIAGTGTSGGSEYDNEIPAMNVKFNNDAVIDMVVGPDGSVYYAYKKVVRRLYLDGPGSLFGLDDIEIPSADGSETHVFDDEGRHLSTRDSLTGVTIWEFAYDGSGRLVTMTDRDGRDTTIERDGSGVALSITSPEGLVTTLDVVDNQLVSIVDEASSEWGFEYDEESGLLTVLTDPREYLHEFTYDENGRLEVDEDPASGSKTLTRTNLDDGYEVAVETALGQTNIYRVEAEVDGAKLRTVREYPDGTSAESESFLDGHSERTFADGTVVTTWKEPDPRFGTLALVPAHMQVAIPSGPTLHTYSRRFQSGDDWVDQVSRNSNFADPMEYRYDTVTRITTITTPEGRVTTFEVDALGHLVEYTGAGSTTVTFDLDEEGRVEAVEQGTGGDLRKRTAGRDASGFVDLMTAFLGMVERDYGMTHDGVGRILTILLPDLESIGLTWDEEGRPLTLTVPTEEPHAMSYDPVGMMTEYNPPDVAGGPDPDETSYVYDDDHRLTQVTLPDAATIAIDYNATTHRIDEVITSDGGDIVQTFDAAARLDTLAGPYWDGDPGVARVTLDYGYTGPAMVSEEWSGVVEGTVSHTLNSRALIGAQLISGSSSVSFTYDDDDLLLTAGSITLGRGASTGRIETVAVSAIDQTLTYNAFGEVDGSVYEATTDLYEYSLERDQLAHIVEEAKITDAGTPIVWSYEYDDRGRLERVEKDASLFEEYTYDANGNRLSVETTGGTTYATYDEQDRITTFGDWDYTHGDNGEIETKSDGTDDWAYEWDALGNLLSVTLPDTTDIRFEYDARGRPVARFVDDVFDKGWLWAGQLEPIAEVDDEGTLTARYVYGSREHVPDYVITGGVTYRLITDYRGSVVRVVRASDGVEFQEVEYGPWGEVLSESGAGFQSFGYAGGIVDEDTGLVLFGARWYDPSTGRWMSKDPIRFGGGQENLYLYVDAAPIDDFDPTGLVVEVCHAPMFGPGPAGYITHLIPGNLLDHQFLKTDRFEFGMGFCEDAPLPASCIGPNNGRSNAHGAECEAVPDADEVCVDAFMMIGYMWIGRYGWGDNCGDFVDEVLTACGAPRCGSSSCRVGDFIDDTLLSWDPPPVHEFQ